MLNQEDKLAFYMEYKQAADDLVYAVTAYSIKHNVNVCVAIEEALTDNDLEALELRADAARSVGCELPAAVLEILEEADEKLQDWYISGYDIETTTQGVTNELVTYGRMILEELLEEEANQDYLVD